MSKESPHPPRQPLTVLPDAITPISPQRQAERLPDASPTAPPAKPLTPIEKKLLEGQVIKAIRSIYDPEIPINIWELGLIYSIDVDETAAVKIKMTLTAPACPVAGSLPGEVEKRVESIPEVRSADVELVWDPPWTKDRMSELARLTLDL
jgi:FeS assembly SUF system protein